MIDYRPLEQFLEYETSNRNNGVPLSTTLKNELEERLGLDLSEARGISIKYNDEIFIDSVRIKFRRTREVVNVINRRTNKLERHIVYFTGNLREFGDPEALSYAGMDAYLCNVYSLILKLLDDIKIITNTDFIEGTIEEIEYSESDIKLLRTGNKHLAELFFDLHKKDLAQIYPRFIAVFDSINGSNKRVKLIKKLGFQP